MLTFLIPVRHPAAVKDWDGVCGRMMQTIASITGQTHPAWKCILAAEVDARMPPMPRGVQIVRTEIPAPDLPDPGQSLFRYWDAIRQDKGARVRAAYRAAAPEGFFMPTDYDDLVSNRLAAQCAAHPAAAGWYIDDGYAFTDGRLMLRMRGYLHTRCGSSNIMAERILAPARRDGSAADQHALTFLGGHTRAQPLLAGTPDALAPLPFAGTLYRVQNGGSATGNSIRSLIVDDHRPLGMLRHLTLLRWMNRRIRQEFFGAAAPT